MQKNVFQANYWKISTVVVFFLLMISICMIIFGVNSKKELQNKNQLLLSQINLKLPINKINNGVKQPKDENLVSFLEKERLLLTQKTSSTQATSYLFGFTMNFFHKDWDCNNHVAKFTSTGFKINCAQKPCKIDLDDLDKRNKSQACLDEENSREYPNNVLPSFVIVVEKFAIDDPSYSGTEDTLYTAAGFQPNKKTPKGIEYKFVELERKEHQGSLRKYQVIFYSPKQLSNLHSRLTGTYYGSEKIYGKYFIDFSFYDYEEKVGQKRIINLTDKIIDSIEFLNPINFN